MNLILQLGSQHSRFAAAQPLLRPPLSLLSIQQLSQQSWPLHDLGFYVRLDCALEQWQQQLFQNVQNLGFDNLEEWNSGGDFRQVNQSLAMGLRIMKKMQFYRIGFNDQKLFYGSRGLLQLYVLGDLKSVSLLSEIEKYCQKQDLNLSPSSLKAIEEEAIYCDVSLKIAKHVLTEFRAEMYTPSTQLVSKLFNIYGFSYDSTASFSVNYKKALAQKQVAPSANSHKSHSSREALIIFFTFKILSCLSQYEPLCHYLSYLKNVLLDRSSGVLTASYELWALLYETSLRLYGRQSACRERGWLEVDQILSSQTPDAEFQAFLLKNAESKHVTLSSINFYLKNSKKEQRAELRPIVEAKIAGFGRRQFWANLEDILEFVQNEVQAEDRQSHIQHIITNTLSIFQAHPAKEDIYQLEYGLAFALQALAKYLQNFQTLLPAALLQRITDVLMSQSAACDPLATLAFRYFDSFLANIYAEADYSQWNSQSLEKFMRIAQNFYKCGFVPSKSTLKLLYNRLSQSQASGEIWERFLNLLTQHYFCGGYEENSDLQLVHSHQLYSEILAGCILKYLQRLVSSQQLESRQLASLLQHEQNKDLLRSYCGVRGTRDELVFLGIQNISLVFGSQLSMQTLEFGLNYCSLFMSLPAWHPQVEGVSLLSLICEEMPIEVLKFAYQELCSGEWGWGGVEEIPMGVWQVFWGRCRGETCFSTELRSSQVAVLQRVRRFQFVVDLANCVFDKLNEQSQKNIKEIKLIFEGGARIAEQLISKLSGVLLGVTCSTLLQKSKQMCCEQAAQLVLSDEQDSVMALTYVDGNSLLKAVSLFNQIGRVTQSDKVAALEKTLLPPFPHIISEGQSGQQLLVCKYFELICTVESTWKAKAGDFRSVVLSKEWAKQTTVLLEGLKERVEARARERQEWKQGQEQEGGGVVEEKLSSQVKLLLSKLVLPCSLTQLLSGETKICGKSMISLMRAAVLLLNSLDPNYEEHFIVQVQTLQEMLKQPNKGSALSSVQILSLLQLFVDLIFTGVRIRSYHLYRIIKHYQRLTAQHPSLFNAVVANYIRLLFQEFVPDYRPTLEIAQLSSSRKQLSSNHLRLIRHEAKFGTIESACTLSMFINLFCRLNHGSLAAGVDRLFAEEEAKDMYLGYLTALTKAIAHQNISISPKDVEILKVDVYGNLNIVAKGKLSERLIKKLVSLAKSLLRVKTEISGIEQLPLKLLAQKMEQERMPLNLQEFEDECKALSLGALSLHRRLAPLISSNLHYCNLFYLCGRNFEQNVEINKKLLGGSREGIQKEVRRVGREGVQGLRVQFRQGVTQLLDSLVLKIEQYHQLCGKQPEYAQKLYASFKILCINCLNTPEIMPYVLSRPMAADGTTASFLQFVISTLKLCLPLFCQFVAVITKANWGFLPLGRGQAVPASFVLELKLKEELLALLETQQGTSKQGQYKYLCKALHFMQRFIPENRFKYYRFANFNKEHYQTLAKEANRHFNLRLLQACQTAIRQEHTLQNQFQPITQIFAAAMENSLANEPSVDLKKLEAEEKLRTYFLGHSKSFTQQQDIVGSFKKINVSHKELGQAKSQFTEVSRSSIVLQQALSKIPELKFSPDITTEQQPSADSAARISSARIEQDLIGFCQSKYLISHADGLQTINTTVMEQFRLFSQELQSKDFLKGLTAFPTHEGISLIVNAQPPAANECYENWLSGSQEDAIADASNECDGIVESMKELEQPSCEELVNPCSQAIELGSAETGSMLPEIESMKRRPSAMLHSANIIYSQMEIKEGEDGSMKLCGEEESSKELRSIHEAVSKEDILSLIQDYTLNPEAIKQIALRIRYLPTEELEKLQAQQTCEILFVIEAELRNRSIFPLKKEKAHAYDSLFIDEAKLFEKVKHRGRNETRHLEIPQINAKFASQWLLELMKKGAEGKWFEQKQFSSFIRTLFLDQLNTKLVISAALQILTATQQQFQSQCPLDYTDKSPAYYKQLLIDQFFSALVEQRIGLPIIFFGFWSGRLTNEGSKQNNKKRVIEILLLALIQSPQKESLFLNKVLEYINVLNQATKFSYPYLDLQDAISIPPEVITELSEKLRQRRESFSENQKLLCLFKMISYLELKCLQEFLRVQLSKTAEEVKRLCQKEEQVLQQFQRQFAGAQKIDIDRKTEIYWGLKKSKHLSESHSEIALSRRILSDTVTKVLPTIKENVFCFYYRQEDCEMKQELSYLQRKTGQARHYWERYQLQKELQERKKCYEAWKRSNLNSIVREEIGPAFEEVAARFQAELRRSTGLLAQLFGQFGEIRDKHPLLFAVCAQFYWLMLAFEAAKKEEEQSHYSLSLLKTLPSIQSTREATSSKRRTSLNPRPPSLQGTPNGFAPALQRFASLLPKSLLEQNPKNALMVLHGRYADTETKLSLLKEENPLGEKVIEVARESMWQDTYPHLDQSFGKHDIKIKISGELGIDYGGITREWAAQVIKQITNPNLGLFQLSANELCLQPSKLSYLVPNHLDIFYRIGIFIGKALKEGWLMEINFTKSFLKHILGATLYVEDLEDIEPYTAKGLLWILENEVGDELGFSFTYEQEMMGEKRVGELVPGGSQVWVTDSNKKEYVKKLAYLKMTENIREQSIAFMEGLEKVVPLQLLKLLTYKEVGKFFAGHSTIDLKEMRKFAKYEGCSEEDTAVKWFWECLGQKREEEVCEFLFFVTGSYRVPYSGFEKHPITINKLTCSKDYCPVAHTCFSIIDLPEYSSKEKLSQMLHTAIKEGRGFTVS